MLQLNLSQDEASALKDALTTYISDLRMEIADTDQMEFREDLKREEELLSRILENLEK